MTRNGIGRLAGARKRMLIAGIAVLAPLAMASPAMAEHHPKGNFAPFKYCPLSNKATELCTVANTNAGEFTVGTKTVPITNTITLQGGLHENESTGELEFIAAEGAQTLSKTEETVPGGLLGIKAPSWWPLILQELFNEYVINKGLTGVTEITELAKPASAIKLNTTNLIFEEGVALQSAGQGQAQQPVPRRGMLCRLLLETDRAEPDDRDDEPAVAEQTDQRQRGQPGNPRIGQPGAPHGRRARGQLVRG